MNTTSTLQSVVNSLGEHGEKTALLAITKRDQQRWSYRKLGDCARSFANGLVKAGFRPGDSIALFAENRPEWIAAALGVIRAGAVAVPLDIQFGDEDLAHILSDSEASGVITTQQRVTRLDENRVSGCSDHVFPLLVAVRRKKCAAVRKICEACSAHLNLTERGKAEIRP